MRKVATLVIELHPVDIRLAQLRANGHGIVTPLALDAETQDRQDRVWMHQAQDRAARGFGVALVVVVSAWALAGRWWGLW